MLKRHQVSLGVGHWLATPAELLWLPASRIWPTTLIVPHSLCQEQLPATGVPITRQRFDHMRRMFDEYVCSSTLQNWKFWIVSFGVSACCSLSPSTRHQVFWFICCYRVFGVPQARETLFPS